MNEFKVEDYSIFPELSNSITETITKMETLLNDCNQTMNDVCCEDTFLGPISTNCLESWDTIYQAIKTPTNALEKSAKYVAVVNMTYSESDKTNAANISGV